MSAARHSASRSIAAHAVLIAYTIIALFPVFVTVVNSFKSRKAIFADPLALPVPRPLIWSATRPSWRRAISCNIS